MLPALEQATSAAVGGAIATAVLFPLDALRTKLAASTREGDTAAKTVARIVQTQGVLGLFGGLSPKLMQSVLGKFLYFLFYTGLVNKWAAVRALSATGPVSTYELLVFGYLAEAMHLPLTIPFEVVTTRMQKEDKAQGALSIVRSLYASGSLWKGWQAYAYLCCQPAIQFVLFEKLKGGASLSSLHAFILGAAARAVAVLLTFPFTRARTLLQTRKDKEEDPKQRPQSILGLLAALVREGGFFSLYRGFGPELLRGVLSSAIMLMIKEKVQIKLT